jgi:hypothetical protein
MTCIEVSNVAYTCAYNMYTQHTHYIHYTVHSWQWQYTTENTVQVQWSGLVIVTT